MAKIIKKEFLGNGLSVEIKQSTPPARFTESTLNKELEKQGVGRPATYATICNTVTDPSRGYATMDAKTKIITPTDKGMQLAAFLERSFSNIIRTDYTRDMEANLDKIADGKLTKTTFLTEFYTTLEDTIKTSPELKGTQTTDKVCPQCGKSLVVRRSKYGTQFLACSGYPNCKYTESIK